MKLALVGAVLIVVGAVSIATGLLPLSDAIELGDRVWPILLFVVAITVVTELASDAELFRVIAERAGALGRGRAWVLWLMVVVLAVLATVFLSLDTTAVLLTPVVILLARHAGLPPLPFALTTVWLANTASLLLPVSNLTNLLAQRQLGGISPLAFAGLMAAPAVAAVLVPVVILAILFRRSLTVRYTVTVVTPVQDRVLLIVSGVVLAVMLPSFLTGIEVWIPALAGAIVLIGVYAARRRERLRLGLAPWSLVLFAAGLFLVVETGHAIGLTAMVDSILSAGRALPDLLQLAAAGAVSSNLVNNLPAYLALEPLAGDPVRLAALLVGVNAGPLITPWASLATLLWHDRLSSLDVTFSWWRYAVLGCLVAPLTVIAAVVALWAFSH